MNQLKCYVKRMKNVFMKQDVEKALIIVLLDDDKARMAVVKSS